MTSKDITIKSIVELYNSGRQGQALNLAKLNNLTISEVWNGWARIQAAKKENKQQLIKDVVESKQAAAAAQLVQANAQAKPMNLKPFIIGSIVIVVLYFIYSKFKKK